MSPAYQRRQRATKFLAQAPDAAFAEYDSMTEAERFDLLACLERDERAVFEAALAERQAAPPRFKFGRGPGSGGFGAGGFATKGDR